MRLIAAFLLAAFMAAPALAQTRDELWSRCKSYDENIDLAIGACTALIQGGTESDANLSSVFMHRGNAYNKKGDADRALKEYEVALKLDASNAKAYFNRSVVHLDRGDFDAALRDADAGARADSSYGSPLVIRGEVSRRRGRYAEAVTEFDKALSLTIEESRTQSFARDRRARSEQAKRCGDPLADLSIGACTAILNDTTMTPAARASAFNRRGVAHNNSRAYAKAVADYGEAIRIEPSNAVFLANRGSSSIWTGQFEQAAQDLQRSLSIDPKRVATINSLGLLARQRGNYAEALERFTAAIAQAPPPENETTATYINNRAITHLMLGRDADATADVERALRINPKYANGLFVRAVLRHRKGDLAGAAADLAASKALEADIEEFMASRNVRYPR